MCVQPTTQFREHPARHIGNDAARCIPLTVHSDGVPRLGAGKGWCKLFDVYSWGSMLTASENMSQPLFWAFCTLNKMCVRD